MNVGVPCGKEGCGKQKRWLFLYKETMTGNMGTAAENQNVLHRLSVPASSIPSTLLPRNMKSSRPVSPDHVINDDRFWGHKQRMKSLWDFRELHPLRFKYLGQKHRAKERNGSSAPAITGC